MAIFKYQLMISLCRHLFANENSLAKVGLLNSQRTLVTLHVLIHYLCGKQSVAAGKYKTIEQVDIATENNINYFWMTINEWNVSIPFLDCLDT